MDLFWRLSNPDTDFRESLKNAFLFHYPVIPMSEKDGKTFLGRLDSATGEVKKIPDAPLIKKTKEGLVVEFPDLVASDKNETTGKSVKPTKKTNNIGCYLLPPAIYNTVCLIAGMVSSSQKPSISEERLAEIKEFFAKYSESNPNVVGIIVFGSTARGKAKEKSDLDFIIVLNEGWGFPWMNNDVEEFYRVISNKFKYIKHRSAHLVLNPNAFSDNKRTIAMFMKPKFIPEKWREKGKKPIIEDYLVIAKTPEKEKEIKEIIAKGKKDFIKDFIGKALENQKLDPPSPNRLLRKLSEITRSL